MSAVKLLPTDAISWRLSNQVLRYVHYDPIHVEENTFACACHCTSIHTVILLYESVAGGIWCNSSTLIRYNGPPISAESCGVYTINKTSKRVRNISFDTCCVRLSRSTSRRDLDVNVRGYWSSAGITTFWHLKQHASCLSYNQSKILSSKTTQQYNNKS